MKISIRIPGILARSVVRMASKFTQSLSLRFSRRTIKTSMGSPALELELRMAAAVVFKLSWEDNMCPVVVGAMSAAEAGRSFLLKAFRRRLRL